MIERVEKWVEAARWETDVRAFPRLAHLERLVERSAPWLELAEGEETLTIHLPEQGLVLITMERGLDPDSYEWALAEELGHALFTHGLAAAVRRQRPPLARRNEQLDEGIASAFREAWFLPASLVLARWRAPWTIVRESGCSYAFVQRRRSDLWPLTLPDAGLPAWLDPPAWAIHLPSL